MGDSDGIELTERGGGATGAQTGGRTVEKGGWKRVSRASSRTKQFFTDEADDKQSRELMNKRRMAAINKFSGQKPEASTDVADGALSRRKRDAAPVVLFKAAQKKMAAKPASKPTWESYGGRSFLSSDWRDDDGTDTEDDDELAADFFNFVDLSEQKDQLKHEAPYMQRKHTTEGIEEIGHAGASVKPKEKRKKELPKREPPKKASYVFGKMLGRRLKRNVSDDKEFDDRREYFTSWLSFVQVVIMIVVLCIYPFAPIGIDEKIEAEEVTLSREGVLYKENLEIKIIESFWLGPSLESLILLGAKYAPCMRRDDRVFEMIIKDRTKENNTGCCMAVNTNGCIQRDAQQCMTPAVEFGAGKVCGQDPDYCLFSTPPVSEWDRQSIMTWPTCEKQKPPPPGDQLRHLTCQVAGRPCCVKTQGQCVITTKENCDFRRGVFHPTHTLCSQVDCLSATCGNSFYNNDQPDQIYRLFISLFLCAGILHLIVVLIFNATILRDIEGYAGCWRTGAIFILTGIGGNLWSAILLPYQAEVGESGAMFGIFACVFVEGIRKWQLLVSPGRYIGKLILILFVALLFGLLPMVDNYAHIFGFLYGILLGFPLLPTIPTANKDDDPEGYKRETRINLFVNILCLAFAILLSVLGVFLFYFKQDMQSSAIALFNCPFGERFCKNFHQGQQLEPRLVQY